MNSIFIYIILVVISIIIGFIFGKLLERNSSSKSLIKLDTENKLLLEEKETNTEIINNLKTDIQQLNNQNHQLDILLNEKKNQEENLKEKFLNQKAEIENLQKTFKDEFKNLANAILEEKSKKFTDQYKESLKTILDPLQQKIKTFEEKVETSQKESIGMHAALKEQLSNLQTLNVQMSKEANNLTKALKGDSKTQGNWGELVLERVLEKSGLEKDREYFVQQSFTNEDGKRLVPDVIIHLPDHKKMIVDSKVTLTAYENFTHETDENKKNNYLKEHVQSLKRHIEQLSAKKYETIYETESPDFVLMFIPIEPAFAIALNADNQLYNNAFEKNIVIVTPTTLLATLRTIDSMWNNEKQQQNAQEIAKQAGNLYDQFVNLTNDLILVGKQLNTVQGSYDSTMKKLTGKGNLIKKVENIKKLGVKSKKILNEKLLERANEE
ncbi:MAG: DNA recombination protein RmuC [Lutibacter sp.]